MLRARAEVNATLERYEIAQDTLEELQSGSQALDVSSASAAISLAEAQAAQAQAALEQSRAAGKTLQVQLDKSAITSPADGLMLYRNLEPGEIISTGEVVMTVAICKKST